MSEVYATVEERGRPELVQIRRTQESSRPQKSMGNWQLTDLIDVETLQSIQDTFAKVFKLPTVIIDPAGRNLTEITHRLSFCEDLTRPNEVAGARCTTCDREAMEAAAVNGRPEIFRCWNGLYDSAIPIAAGGSVLGYILCGQIFDSHQDPVSYRSVAAGLGIEAERYADALQDVQIVSLDDYKASVETMHVLAQMIAEQAAAAIENFQALQQAIDARSDASALITEFDRLFEAFTDIGSQPDDQSMLVRIRTNLEQLISSEIAAIYVFDESGGALSLATASSDHEPSQIPMGQGPVGEVALTGIATAFDLSEGDQVSTALVVPLTHKGSLLGLAVLRRLGGGFDDHEISLASVLMTAAGAALNAARLHDDLSARLREERLLSTLLTELSQRLTVQQAMKVVGRVGMELLGATQALLRFTGSATSIHRFHLDSSTSDRLVHNLGADIDRALGQSLPIISEFEGRACVIVPFGSDGGSFGCGIFVDPESPMASLRVANALSNHAGLGLDNARMLQREKEIVRRYRDLSELSTDLLDASDDSEVIDRLAEAAPSIIGSDIGAIVTMAGTGANVTWADSKRHQLSRLRVDLATNARMAAIRLGSGASDRALFLTWIEDVLSTAKEVFRVESHLSEPLIVNGEFRGAVIVGWRAQDAQMNSEERHLLSLLATAAAGGIGQHIAHAATDAALRQRLGELHVLADLAHKATAAGSDEDVIEEVTVAFRDLARLDGAAFVTRCHSEMSIAFSCGDLPNDLDDRVPGVGRSLDDDSGIVIDGGTVVMALAPDGGCQRYLTGWAKDDLDPSARSALWTLGRYASVAIENTQLHQQRATTIARLETLNQENAAKQEELQSLLSVHRDVGEAAIQEGGLESITMTLNRLIDSPVAVVHPDGTKIVSCPAEFEPNWRPPEVPDSTDLLIEAGEVPGQLVALPVRSEQHAMGWIVTTIDQSLTPVVRAALTHGALVAALVLLQEKTAAEVEARLKGDFLDQLLTGGVASERLERQARTLGIDLQAPARFIVVEPANGDVSEHDLNLLHRAVVSAGRLAPIPFVASIRGTRIVAIAFGLDDEAIGSFRDNLRNTLETRMGKLKPNLVFGTPCTKPAQYQESFLVAVRGLELLAAMGRSSATFLFDEQGLEQLLLRSASPSALLDFVSRFVRPIAEHDESHSSELRKTLVAFYDSDLNLQAAARALHIHVSTLRYRLRRISEILGVDPREGPTRLDLEVALRAARILETV